MRMSSILEPKNMAARKNPTAIGWFHLQVGTETMPAVGPIPGMNKAFWLRPCQQGTMTMIVPVHTMTAPERR